MVAGMKPTIGRIVHFHDHDGDGPHAAIITRVHSDTCVDLYVLPQDGTPIKVTSVVEMEGDSLGRWEWPPRV